MDKLKTQKNKLGRQSESSNDSYPSRSLSVYPKGYFPLWRKITEWGWYKNSNTKAVFIHLLLLCNHKERNYLNYKILPGQCITGRKKLSVDLGLSEQSIRTAINHLKSTSEITSKTYNKFSIITINNYPKYTIATSEPTNNQPATNQQLTTPNNYKNVKNYNKSIPPPLTLIKDFFKELNKPLEADPFYDYFQSNGWKVGGKAPMKDWKAAARNWCRRSFGTTKVSTDKSQEFKKEKEVRVDHSPEGKAKVKGLIDKALGRVK